MFEYLKAVKDRILKEFDCTVMFFLGYIIASVATATISFIAASIMCVGIRLNILDCREAHEELIDISRESFDRFLNHILVLLPDKLRESLGYELGTW